MGGVSSISEDGIKERQVTAMNEPFFPDPNEAGSDRNLVGVFLLALALMIGLTIIIYYSGLWQAAGKFLLRMLGS